MQVNATLQTGLPADRRPRTSENSPISGRALVVVEKTASSTRRLPETGHAPQRSTAFLAQLSLQYDGVTARRRERSERLAHALASYGARRQPKYHPTLSVAV